MLAMRTNILRRLSNGTIIAAFAALLVAPLLGVSTAPWDPLFENRAPAPWPGLARSISEWSAFPWKFEAYFNDHFRLRNRLISWRNEIDFYVFRQSPTPRVLLGKDNWLYYAEQGSVDDFMGRSGLTEEDLAKWDHQLRKRHDALAARGIAYYFLVTANKQSIYPEHMPPNVVRSGQTQLTRLLAYMDRRGRPSWVVDLRPVLLAAKGAQPLYHKIDVHWNDYGSFLGYKALVGVLQRDGLGIRDITLGHDKFKPFEMWRGDLAAMMGFAIYPVATTTMVYVGPPFSFIDVPDPRPVPDVRVTPGIPDRVTVCEQAKDASKLLVFHDSMTNALQPYVSDSFSYVRYVSSYPRFDELMRYVEVEQPQVVIEERIERTLIAVPE
jgi:alginate O-acetyltransferase complex protein AlgJ